MVNTAVSLGKLSLKNPVLTASGTYGYGEEYRDFLDINSLGGITLKGLTLKPREGNPAPRMAETPSGMLNAVGLQNPGVDYFRKNIAPKLAELQCAVIANVNGNTIEEYVELSKLLTEEYAIDALELNISCPNVKQGGIEFGRQAAVAKELVAAVRVVTDKTLIVKLSPNVTDIVELAKAVEEAGADALALINTLIGMAVDLKRDRPLISTVTAGLSGPAIKPVALRMVWQVFKEVQIPIIGMGGIASARDALEFLLCGATAVAVGTANFIDPQLPLKIIEGVERFMQQRGIADINDYIGSLKV